MRHPIKQIVRLAVCSLLFVWSAFSQQDPVALAIANVSNPDYEIRQPAALLLCGKPDDPRTLEPLIGLTTDSSEWIRQMAFGALSLRKDERVIPLLINALSDESPLVLRAAAAGLAQIGDPIAVGPLIEALKTEDEYARRDVMQALSSFDDSRVVRAIFDAPGEFGDARARVIGPRGVDEMIDIARNGSSEERSKAVFVLSYYGDERALDVLISAVRREGDRAYLPMSAIVRRIAGNAVSELHRAFVFPDTNWQFSRHIILMLAQIDDGRAEDALVELASGPDQRQRSYVVNTLAQFANSGVRTEAIVSVMVATTRDDDFENRILAIRSLANSNRDGVHGILIDALSVPQTGIEAAVALAGRGDASGLPILLDMLTMDDQFAPRRARNALVQLGPVAVEGLIAVMNDTRKEFPLRELRRQDYERGILFSCDVGGSEPDPVADPRYLAAQALGSIGDVRARPALIRATKDKADWLRRAATTALQQIEMKTRIAEQTQ